MGLGKGQKPEIFPVIRGEEHYRTVIQGVAITMVWPNIFIFLINILFPRRGDPTAKARVGWRPWNSHDREELIPKEKSQVLLLMKEEGMGCWTVQITNGQYNSNGWKSSKSWVLPPIHALQDSQAWEKENQTNHRAVLVQSTETLIMSFQLCPFVNVRSWDRDLI